LLYVIYIGFSKKVELSMPLIYQQKMREDLQMSAKSVKIGFFHRYYYAFAMKLMTIMRDDALYNILFKVQKHQ
jgi:hypothetical protein